jgi:beta-phosphoglucomutase
MYLDVVKPPLAFLFDLDGVIVDSMPMHTLAWNMYMDSLGIRATDLVDRMHGRRNDEIVHELIGSDLSAAQVYEHGAAKESLFRRLMADKLTDHLVPGVVDFIRRHADVPMAVGSNAEPANVDFVLDGAGLRRYFKVIVDGMQVKRPKPSPDVYLRAADLLGVEPRFCVVFEDSPAGVEAARAAGSHVVGVETHGELLGVDLRIANFEDTALEAWLSAELSEAGERA